MTNTPSPLTAGLPVDTALGMVLRMQSDWMAQMIALQSAWLSSWSDWQQQAQDQGWPAQNPWLAMMLWQNGTEQLA